MGSRLLLLLALLALAACDSYRPGTDGSRATLQQNLSAHRSPQPPGSMNH